MKPGRPSLTARFVAMERAALDRPTLPTGDAAAEARLYRSLALSPWLSRAGAGAARMGRRTGFVDRAVLDALDRGVAQIVIVGAGYDGRPLRFATPGVRWFEVDHPATQADKTRRLAGIGAEVGHIAFVTVDLTTDDLPAALAAAGFDAARPALFVVEGVLSYLERPVAARLLASLRRLAAEPESRLAVTTGLQADSPRGRARHRVRAVAVKAFGEPWVTRYRAEEVDRLVTEAGWKAHLERDGGPHSEDQRAAFVLGEPAPGAAPAPLP